MKRVVNIIKRIFANLKLRNKFFIIIFSVAAAAWIVIAMFFSFVLSEYDKMLYENMSQLLNMSGDNIEFEIKKIEKVSEEIVQNDTIQKELFEVRKKEPKLSYQIAIEKVYNVLKYYYSNNINIISMVLYTDDQRIYVGRDPFDEANELLKKAISKAKKAKGKSMWFSTDRKDSSIICVRDIRQMENLNLESLGILVIRVDLKKIVNTHLQNSPNLKYPPTIQISSNGEIFYTNMEVPIERKNSSLLDVDYKIQTIQGNKYFTTYSSNSQLGWEYAMYLPFNNVMGSIDNMRLLAFVIGIIVVIISMFLCVIMVSQITKHFDKLIYKMKEFKTGNFTLDTSYDYSLRKDEIGFMHQNFDSMVKDIQRLVEDNYEKQLLIKDAQFKSLEQQINPHFLFNVLQTVNWKAKTNNQQEIVQIIEALGKLLRYTLSQKSDMVLIEQEIDVTRNFIAIQKARYKQRLIVLFDIPKTLYKIKIPKMTIQPIVENAIKHTLENMLTPCILQIYAQENEDDFQIFIEDNGPGIDENIMNKIQNNEVVPEGMGIGLLNIQKRIKLLFSDNYGLKLYNMGKGTIVEIYLPKEME